MALKKELRDGELTNTDQDSGNGGCARALLPGGICEGGQKRRSPITPYEGGERFWFDFKTYLLAPMTMENEDFGPMISAVEDVTLGVADCQVELEKAKHQIADLLQQKNASEMAFGQQRAKFMELFRCKEDELRHTQEQLVLSNKSNVELKDKLWRQSAELDDLKTAAAVSEAGKLDEIEKTRRQCEEEIATLRQLIREDQSRWRKEEERLVAEMSELRAQLNQDRVGFLGSLTKTLQNKITPGATRDEHVETIDQDMKKAQEDAELLRSVVQPLEEEIRSLRTQLCQALERPVLDNNGPSVGGTSIKQTDVGDKVKVLQENFKREKSSRTDLEMYVAVLNTQKGVLQEDLDKLRTQLRDVCRLLEEEKLENGCLRNLLRLSNERAREETDSTVRALKLTEAVLTDDQRHQIASSMLDNTSDGKRIQELNDAIEQEEKELEKIKSIREQMVNTADGQMAPPVASGVASHYDSPPENTAVAEDGFSRQEAVTSRRYTLTNAQQESLVAPTMESRASEALVAVAKTESLSAVGMRLITEHDFNNLHTELNAAKEAACRPCDQCTARDKRLNELETRCALLDKRLGDEKQRAIEVSKYIEELETSLKVAAIEASTQITALNSKVQDSMTFLSNTRDKFVSDQKNILQHIAISTEQRTELQNTLDRTRTENELLVGKRSKHAIELQEELINLPDSMEDMHLLLLNYREEVIAAKVAQERAAELLGSELELLRSQADEERLRHQAEQQQLREDVVQLQEQLAIQSSICSELEREKAELAQGTSSAVVDIRLKQTIGSLQQQLQQQQTANRTLEQELYQLRAISGATLRGHPGVVHQMSHTLPPQYHPRSDYGEECPNCRQRYSNVLSKVHCQRCRGVYCSRCVSKTVLFGPNLPPSSVCDSCFASHFSSYPPYR